MEKHHGFLEDHESLKSESRERETGGVEKKGGERSRKLFRAAQCRCEPGVLTPLIPDCCCRCGTKQRRLPECPAQPVPLCSPPKLSISIPKTERILPYPSGSGPGGPMAWGCQHRGGSGGAPRAPLAAASLPRFDPKGGCGDVMLSGEAPAPWGVRSGTAGADPRTCPGSCCAPAG